MCMCCVPSTATNAEVQNGCTTAARLHCRSADGARRARYICTSVYLCMNTTRECTTTIIMVTSGTPAPCMCASDRSASDMARCLLLLWVPYQGATCACRRGGAAVFRRVRTEVHTVLDNSSRWMKASECIGPMCSFRHSNCLFTAPHQARYQPCALRCRTTIPAHRPHTQPPQPPPGPSTGPARHRHRASYRWCHPSPSSPSPSTSGSTRCKGAPKTALAATGTARLVRLLDPPSSFSRLTVSGSLLCTSAVTPPAPLLPLLPSLCCYSFCC